jgi:hypothetical protein
MSYGGQSLGSVETKYYILQLGTLGFLLVHRVCQDPKAMERESGASERALLQKVDNSHAPMYP